MNINKEESKIKHFYVHSEDSCAVILKQQAIVILKKKKKTDCPSA